MSDKLTIQANQSGHLWSDDIEKWKSMCSQDGCVVYAELPKPKGMHILAETSMVWAVSDEQVTIPGYVCVTYKKHAIDPFDLSAQEQREFWTDSMLVAQGVTDVIRPIKMNYEIHGNTMPHLHMHLFPRTPGDVYVGYPIHNRAKFSHSLDDLDNLKQAIIKRLKNAGRLS